MRIRAPQPGFVVARRLQERIHTFVKLGDELCVIGDETAKEVILAMDQPMLTRVQSGQNLSARTTGGAAFEGRLARLTPRASTQAPHPGLCAINGGPLANLSTMDSETEDECPPLVEPVLAARLALDIETSRGLAAGQLCYASTHVNKDSLGHALLVAAQVWIADRLDAAWDEAGR
ncbi:MAG: HlyD family secretion protein [Planctomycetaceae bacterium]|nr:HlyD family secretion protein [Planctomycetaceae bacterium]